MVSSWVALPRLAVVAVAVTACAVVAACAPATATVKPTTPPAVVPIQLAVLPLDVEAFPKAATAINGHLQKLKERKGEGCLYSRVSLEVVQLSIECVEPTSACYSAVGKSLNAERLLLAHIVPARKHSNHGLRVTFTLFDVEKGSAVNVADKTYRSEDDASNGARELIDQLVPHRTVATSTEGGR
jgi:hypothetical protein